MIGFGYDIHKLASGESLILGGVHFPDSPLGTVAHSDGDVLPHAIMDALLGAVALGDIGIHFPNTDPAYKDIDSKILLQHTYNLIKAKKYQVVNVDSSICLEAPKIKKYSGEMRTIIARILEITEEDVSVKATTTEQMGFVGREEGLVAYANVLLQKQ